MSSRFAKFLYGCLFGGCVLLAVFSFGEKGGHAQNRKQTKPEQLVPENPVFFISVDGPAKHKEAFEKTAMHDAIYKSGLADVVEKLIMSIGEANGMAGAIEGPLGKVGEHLEQNGVIISVTVKDNVPNMPALPQLQVIFPKAAVFGEQLNALAQNSPIPLDSREIKGRTVTSLVIPDSPGVEVGFWVEGEHLVIVGGIGAIEAHLAVADGDAKNLTQSKAWAQYGPESADFDLTASVWIDLGQLTSNYGPIPLPVPGVDGAPLTANYFINALGFDSAKLAVIRSGYKDRAIWTESVLQIEGERRGLIALGDQPAMTLADLPPLPEDTTTFVACSFDASAVYTETITTIMRFVAKAPERVQFQVDETIENLPQLIGFDPKADLLDSLSNVACLYVDSSQDFLGAGIAGAVAAIETKDSAKLRRTLDQILTMAEDMSGGDFKTNRTKKNGIEIITFQVESVEIGALAVTDDWLLLSLTPQSIQAFQMRVDGDLPKWKPNAELQAALNDMPKEFTSLVVADPRPIYRQLLSLAPFLMTAAKAGLVEGGLVPRDFEFPVGIADIPPTEIVTRPLFQNITMSVNTKDGFKNYSRNSMPSIPLIGSVGGGGSIATIGVLTALILPAVQQAREAARRSQSKNNLKQLGLALHNYHETFRHLPTGTVENKDLKIEDRLSWVVPLLPFLDQSPLFRNIEQDEAWDSDVNSGSTERAIPTLMSPQVNAAVRGGRLDYVGIAGLGAKAAELPLANKKVGTFGYNRKIRFRDVTDGTSTTIGITEIKKGFGNWARGGKSSIRAVTTKPYINGPDGIGSDFRGGMHALLLDGSVRFISENIDPTVFEALITIHGRENIPGF